MPKFTFTPASSGSSVSNSFSRTFVDADLVAGILTINHALGNSLVDVTIRDSAGAKVMQDDDTIIDVNNVAIDLSSFQPLVGVWAALVVGL
jgi:hypothetical protein